MKKRHTVRIEMTPLMDVMFLVLVFFIYCIFDMAVHKGVKVDLPNAAGADEKGERIVITIRPDDTLQFNGEPMTREAAVAKVRELYAVNMKLPVLVSGDRKASLGTGIELLADLKKAGVEKASFQVSESVAKPHDFGRAGVPPPAAARDGTRALPGFATASSGKSSD